jgi:Flp pilus assembly protein TadD
MIQDKAIKELERGMNHLHRQNYAEALERFRSIIKEYDEDKELQNRALVYARICERRIERKESAAKNPEQCFYLGVLKANEENYDEAIDYLGKAMQANPKDEKVHYVLASTLAQKGDREIAVQHLQKAIELNVLNRVHARNDPDFEQIRDDENFQNLLYPEEA